MSSPSKVRAFNGCYRYLRVINAFDAEHFGQDKWRVSVRSVCYAIGAASVIVILPTAIMLMLWFLIETDADEKKIVATLPLIVSVLQVLFTFIALMMERRILFETIDRIQTAINERKFLVQG